MALYTATYTETNTITFDVEVSDGIPVDEAGTVTVNDRSGLLPPMMVMSHVTGMTTTISRVKKENRPTYCR